jgi:hypothetical protein
MLVRDVVNHFTAVHQRIRRLKRRQRTRDDLVLARSSLRMIHLKFDTASLQGIRDLFEDDGSSAAGVNGCCGGPIMGADRFSLRKCGLQEDEFDLEPNQE